MPTRTRSQRSSPRRARRPPLDEGRADRAQRFFEDVLVHTKGRWAGVAFKLADWQRDDIIRPLFGTLNPDGTRRYRTAYIEVGRKNGKSEIAAGVALYCLVADGEESAEVIAGDAVYIPPGSVQWLENTGQVEIEFICLVDPAWCPEDEQAL